MHTDGFSQNILRWPDNAGQVCSEIAARRDTLKIVLKTKNEDDFLEPWLLHHIPIVGDGKIIVFDHMSTSKTVFDIYKKYADNIILVQFAAVSHDSLHSAAHFSELYQALCDSCDFLTLLDTDEFLYLYDGLKLYNNNVIEKYLQNNLDVPFFSTYWLLNREFSPDEFIFGPNDSDIATCLYNGKAILSSAQMKSATPYVGHAHVVAQTAQGRSPTPFILLHWARLSLKQRIRGNMQKLVTFGVIDHIKNFALINELNINTLKPGRAAIVKELRTLLEKGSFGAGDETNYIKITPTGHLTFTPPELKTRFNKFVSPANDYFKVTGLISG